MSGDRDFYQLLTEQVQALNTVVKRGRRHVGPAEVVEPQPQRDRAPGPVRAAHPPGHPVDQRGQRRVDLVERPLPPAERALRADRAAPER